MAITLGYGGAIKLAKEAVWGSPEASLSNSLHVRRCTLQERPQYEAVPVLGPYFDRSRTMIVRVGCAGALELPFLYEGMGLLLEAAMGAAPDTAGSGPFIHTFTRGQSFPGLTIEHIRGSSGKSEIFTGAVIAKWRARAEGKSLTMFSADLLARKATGARGNAGTPTFGGLPQDRAIYPKDYAGSGVPAEITYNSVSYAVQYIEVEVDNKLEGTDELGSEHIISPSPMDQGDVLIRVGLLHRVETLYNAHRAKTQADVSWTTVGAGNYASAWAGRNCELIEYNDEIGGSGRVQAVATFRAQPDNAGGALEIALTNDQEEYDEN